MSNVNMYVLCIVYLNESSKISILHKNKIWGASELWNNDYFRILGAYKNTYISTHFFIWI